MPEGLAPEVLVPIASQDALDDAAEFQLESNIEDLPSTATHMDGQHDVLSLLSSKDVLDHYGILEEDRRADVSKKWAQQLLQTLVESETRFLENMDESSGDHHAYQAFFQQAKDAIEDLEKNDIHQFEEHCKKLQGMWEKFHAQKRSHKKATAQLQDEVRRSLAPLQQRITHKTIDVAKHKESKPIDYYYYERQPLPEGKHKYTYYGFIPGSPTDYTMKRISKSEYVTTSNKPAGRGERHTVWTTGRNAGKARGDNWFGSRTCNVLQDATT